jgi:hypothetical protein
LAQPPSAATVWRSPLQITNLKALPSKSKAFGHHSKW